MNKKKITTGLFLFLAFYTQAKPGETYTLTGTEKGISEIIKADMDEFPELYRDETLRSYIIKFKRENKIGTRKLSPGGQLRFPETLDSIKAKRDEKKKQKEKIRQEEKIRREEMSTPEGIAKKLGDWTANAEFRELTSKLNRKGFFSQHIRVTEVDGRNNNGQIEYRFKYEVTPPEALHSTWRWWYSMDEDFFEKKKESCKEMGLKLVYEQSYTLPSGKQRYQAVWHQ